ncbi:putative B3 domain-containing protein Os04g0347400 [Setaria viridis]|uniref:putative B3 domain-containing protein Os04g0347400 n=1 Tax=Setaria viridis TaxID=4556 RepID=UPI0014936899|nr:putative B3 domain-containing protein Os04g0347400 [Setaria viridis]
MTHLLHSQRIPDELAEGIGAGEARVVGPSGGKVKVWRVEVGRDGDDAFLGRGWPEIAAAFGAGTEATTSSKDVSHRPQFVSVLPHDFMEKMLIPAKFVEHYIPEEHKNSRMAMVIGSLGKICRVELEMNESNLFLRGGWSQVLVSHDVTQANALLLKYEGNMVFTVRVFGPDGFQRESKDKDIRIQQVEQKINPSMVVFESVSSGKQQEAPSESIRNCKSKKDWPSREGQKKPKGSTVSMNEASKRIAVYEIGPPSWIKKEINTCTLRKKLSLSKSFCDAIGLLEPCTITLKTSMNIFSICDAIGLREPRTITLKTSMSSTRSWQVLVVPNKNSSHYVRGLDWKRFCEENEIKVGDVCTISIVETTLWHIARQ